MKTLLKLFGVFAIATLLFTACSKDDDPADNDLFVGTYEGSVGYTRTGEESGSIQNSNGSVRVVKLSGDNYNFLFSDDIPDLTNITMQQGANNMLTISNDEFGMIRITASSLSITYATDGQTWTANCER